MEALNPEPQIHTPPPPPKQKKKKNMVIIIRPGVLVLDDHPGDPKTL